MKKPKLTKIPAGEVEKMWASGEAWMKFAGGERVDFCSLNHVGLAVGFVKPMRRKSDGSLYGFKCSRCKATWKIYQNACTCGSRQRPKVKELTPEQKSRIKSLPWHKPPCDEELKQRVTNLEARVRDLDGETHD